VASVCDELHAPYPPGTTSLKVLTDGLNRRLLDTHAQGRRTVLVIDEAQNLSAEALEQVRLLTNLETTTRKLLQILLIGQPELRDLMARPELRQLAQRVTARYHLQPLSREETTQYVRHRLEVAGAKEPIFTPAALRTVHALSGGVPRLVNILCDRALLGAYAQGVKKVKSALVRKGAQEVRGQLPAARKRTLLWAGGLAGLALLALAGAWLALGPGGSSGVPADGEVFGRPSPAEQPHVPAVPPPESVPLPSAAAVGALAAPPPAPEPEPEPEAVATPAPRPLLERLANGELRADTDAALTTLFGYWHRSYGELPGGTACEKAEATGLRCHLGRGNWTTLGFFNLPAILELQAEDGVRYQAVVAGLPEGAVVLDFAGERVRMEREALEPLWYGQFLLLWQAPPQGSFLLREGSVGADVLWLRAQLDRAEGRVARGDRAAPRFDEALAERVRAFQGAHGLREDGMVGEQTFIQLSTAAGGTSIPALRRP
jgi:general secretion pathway protein A